MPFSATLQMTRKGVFILIKTYYLQEDQMKFLKNVVAELKKAKWPDKKYMVKYTIVTIALVITLALYFYGVTLLVAVIKGLR